jgi:putative NIF3 family GTP cyclohydrolase 1 type 2
MLNTSEVMGLALRMARMERIPADSGIWVPGEGIRKVLFAIDGGTAEIAVAKSLGYDALIAHHPMGPARLRLHETVERQTEFMLEKGVPRKVAEEATEELVRRVEVRSHPANYLQDVDLAKRLSLPLLNIHLPIDQVTRDFLLGAIRRSRARTVGDLIQSLEDTTEFAHAKTRIEARVGSTSNPLGRWALVFAAGTNGGYPVARAYFDSGIDTVIYLHIEYDELVKLRREGKGNLVVLGHMAGDSIGINLFLKQLRRKGVDADTLGVVR